MGNSSLNLRYQFACFEFWQNRKYRRNMFKILIVFIFDSYVIFEKKFIGIVSCY